MLPSNPDLKHQMYCKTKQVEQSTIMQKEHIFVQGAGGQDSTTCGPPSSGFASCTSRMSLIRNDTTDAMAWDMLTNEYVVQLGGAYIVLAGVARWAPVARVGGGTANQITVNRGETNEYIGCSSGYTSAAYDQASMVGCVLNLYAGDRLGVEFTTGVAVGRITTSGNLDNFLSVTRLG